MRLFRRDRRIDLLRTALGSADHPRRELARVAKLFRCERYATGAVLCAKGETGHEAYLIVEGKVSVTDGRTSVGTRGPGEFVGEMALVNDEPRTATVTADGTLCVLTIDRSSFSLLAKEPAFRRVIDKGLGKRPAGSKRRSRRSVEDPTDWKILLEASRARRAKARRRRLAGLAATTTVFLLVAGVAIRAVAHKATPVSVDDAVARFRAASAPASAPELAPSPAEAADASTQAPSKQASTQPSPSVGPVAQTAAQPEALVEGRRMPEAGVYLYDTQGFDEIELFGGSRHEYPEQTTITVTHTACGADVRWDALEERWERAVLCAAAGRAIEVREFVAFHSFYEQAMTKRYACRPSTLLRPATDDPGATFGGGCSSNDGAAEVSGRVSGVETLTVGGQAVDALRVRIDETLTGSTRGTRTGDTWFKFDDGLLLKRVSRTQAQTSTPAGPTTYREELTLQLTSLSPMR